MTGYDVLFKPVRRPGCTLVDGAMLQCTQLGFQVLTCYLPLQQKPKLKERMQLLSQSRSAIAASQPAEDLAVTVSAGSAPAETAGAATADQTLSTSTAADIPRPSAAQDWRSKRATADSAVPGNATVSGGCPMAGTQMPSQMLDAYSSEFAWMRSLPAPASASAPLPPSATAAEVPPSAQGTTLPAVPVGDGDGERSQLRATRQDTPAST